jgi:hypothetical protein
MLKKEIKCGGVQQIEFGKIKKNEIKQILKIKNRAFRNFFVLYIYKWQELIVVIAQCAQDQWLVAVK